MRIALIQQHATSDIPENLERGINAIKDAAKNGADIVCFAELAFTPFYPQKKPESDIRELAETIPGRTTDIVSETAKKSDVTVIINMFEIDKGLTYDTSPVINSNGEIMGKTRMVHIPEYDFFYEKRYYTPGNLGTPVYHTPFGNIGIAICYDRHFPEYLRSLSLKGAEIVFIPQAGAVNEWPEGLFEAEMRIAAFQNGYFTALCNRVGKEEMIEFGGGSFACNPDGEVIARAEEGSDEILYCDINIDEVKKSNAKKLFIPDRREDIYGYWKF